MSKKIGFDGVVSLLLKRPLATHLKLFPRELTNCNSLLILKAVALAV